jgi:superfamily I DNA/RNA helicase
MILAQDSLALRQWLEIADIPHERVQECRRAALQKPATLYAYCQLLDDLSLAPIFLGIDRLRSLLDDVPAFLRALVDFPCLKITPERLTAAGLDREALIDKRISVGSIVTGMHEEAGLIEGDGETPESNAVLVTTLHKSKGLEAAHVFITHLSATFLPLPNSDPEEARRIFYVALTRLKPTPPACAIAVRATLSSLPSRRSLPPPSHSKYHRC